MSVHDNRGVFMAPWVGPNDEVVLFARDRHLVGVPEVVEEGADLNIVSEFLWGRLDGADPLPQLAIVR